MATTRKTDNKKQTGTKKINFGQIISKTKQRFQDHQIMYSVLGTLLAVVILIGVLFILRKDFFIAGSINGELVTTPQFYNRMLAESGEATFESIVRETLIEQEAKKQNITASEADIDQKVKEIEDRFGGSAGLEQALTANKTSMKQLRDQLKNQLLVEKLLEDKIKVSDKEIDDYIKQNKQTTQGLSREEVRDQLRSNKLNEEFSKWFEEIRKSANIQNYFK
ncbi:MAG: hypothetical protein A3A57_00900 [Candidatus Woykebacteria bacterium RIFCSPLOWO2_01_FULL_41_12]|uniref:peptidylprolyl isomerase n=1 Tax=Candidatus Woykebacteria bacterium RIFCSPLOWO2_01_FULL_41_12 TaxID=1802604 RepID=A0A1G1WSN9_9BACT|nr:MAG: hypothetical protein A3A57_00900 [Candidatus Woykebacteria bacterium RIFCSPLOWO2_01_FULL_41_12]